MNKLVSKNPIQRFKQGKKILKGQKGLISSILDRGDDITTYLTSGIPGLAASYVGGFVKDKTKNLVNSVKEKVKSTFLENNDSTNQYQDIPVTGKIEPNYFSTMLSLYPNINPDEAVQLLKRNLTDHEYHTIKNNIGHFNSIIQNNKLNNSKPQNKIIIPKTPVNNYYLKGFENRKDEITDVRATQQMLKDAGFDIGKYGVDGKWGKDTENAYKKYLLNKEKPVIAPTIQQISQTPLDNTIHKGFTQVMNTPPIIANLPTQPSRNGNFNKSQIRNLISQGGFDPYKYTGAQRKALRLYLNGESDDTSLLDGTDLARFTLPFRKQGGRLVSRNPIKRFKQNKK